MAASHCSVFDTSLSRISSRMNSKEEGVALIRLWQIGESKRIAQESGTHSMILLTAGSRTFVKRRLERVITGRTHHNVRATSSVKLAILVHVANRICPSIFNHNPATTTPTNTPCMPPRHGYHYSPVTHPTSLTNNPTPPSSLPLRTSFTGYTQTRRVRTSPNTSKETFSQR